MEKNNKITPEMWKQAIKEGEELRIILEKQIRPMRILTQDDLNARVK